MQIFSRGYTASSCKSCRRHHRCLVLCKIDFCLYATCWTGIRVEPQRLPLLEPRWAVWSWVLLSFSWLWSRLTAGSYSPLGSGSIWHHDRPLKFNLCFIHITILFLGAISRVSHLVPCFDSDIFALEDINAFITKGCELMDSLHNEMSLQFIFFMPLVSSC